ncbi:MAG: hypothetical protein ABW065_10030 [Solirubrobacterales bacterium]
MGTRRLPIAVLLALALLALAAPGAGATPARFFSWDSPWNRQVAPTAALDPGSSEAVGALYREVQRELAASEGPGIAATYNSVPIYEVPASQPTVPIQLVSRWRVPSLESAWSAVPLPASAQAAPGNDRHLLVWQPSTDRLWEFWHLAKTVSGWQAEWGGAMEHASTSSGVYGSSSWPGADGTWGATASSFSLAGGLITLEDLAAGEINHALAIALPRVRAGTFAAPAARSDGNSWVGTSLPEGARLRLDPTLELWRLHLPPLTLMLARAAQRYGIYVRDVAGTVTFYAQDPAPTGTDPYYGPGGYFEDTYPARLLASFPWKRLQLLSMQLTAMR